MYVVITCRLGEDETLRRPRVPFVSEVESADTHAEALEIAEQTCLNLLQDKAEAHITFIGAELRCDSNYWSPDFTWTVSIHEVE